MGTKTKTTKPAAPATPAQGFTFDLSDAHDVSASFGGGKKARGGVFKVRFNPASITTGERANFDNRGGGTSTWLRYTESVQAGVCYDGTPATPGDLVTNFMDINVVGAKGPKAALYKLDNIARRKGLFVAHGISEEAIDKQTKEAKKNGTKATFDVATLTKAPNGDPRFAWVKWTPAKGDSGKDEFAYLTAEMAAEMIEEIKAHPMVDREPAGQDKDEDIEVEGEEGPGEEDEKDESPKGKKGGKGTSLKKKQAEEDALPEAPEEEEEEEEEESEEEEEEEAEGDDDEEEEEEEEAEPEPEPEPEKKPKGKKKTAGV